MHGMLVCRLLESMHQEVTQQDPSTHVGIWAALRFSRAT